MNKKFKFNKKVLLILVIILLIVAGIVKGIRSKQKSIKKVSIEKLSRKSLFQSISATGNIEANNRNEIMLNPTQKIVEIKVKEGDIVKKGQVLMKLDATDYENQLVKAQLNLKNLQDTLLQITGKETLNKKENATNSIKQAEIALETAKNNYNDLKKKLSQNKSLYENGYISKNDYETAKKVMLDGESAVKNATIALETAKNNSASINVSMEDKVILQNNQISMVKADIESLKKKIDDCYIKAGISGKIIKLDGKQDQYPKNGDGIVIDDISKYKVKIKMNQYDAVKVKLAQKCDIKIKGLNKKYKGSIQKIGQVAKPKITGVAGGGAEQEFNVDVDIIINNVDNNIKSGYEADVDVIVGEKDGVLSIPFDSVIIDKKNDKNFVLVLDKNNKVLKKSVKLGMETDYDVEVLSGIKEGEKCIINPPEDIKEGETVQIADK